MPVMVFGHVLPLVMVVSLPVLLILLHVVFLQLAQLACG
jgi:hypothetical protein